jgi:hypothetical protein
MMVAEVEPRPVPRGATSETAGGDRDLPPAAPPEITERNERSQQELSRVSKTAWRFAPRSLSFGIRLVF